MIRIKNILSQNAKKNADGQTSPPGSKLYPLTPGQPWISPHTPVLSCHRLALVYNNVELLLFSNRPWYLPGSAEHVTHSPTTSLLFILMVQSVSSKFLLMMQTML